MEKIESIKKIICVDINKKDMQRVWKSQIGINLSSLESEKPQKKSFFCCHTTKALVIIGTFFFIIL